MLMYGFDNSGVLNIDIPDGVLFNLTSKKEGFVTLPLLIPPNNIGRFTDRDFDIAYAQYVMNNDNVFCQFFQIIYNLYIGKDVFILVSSEDWSENILESLLKLIQQRYGYNAVLISENDDYIFAKNSMIDQKFAPGYGMFNLDQDKERFSYIMESYRLNNNGVLPYNLDGFVVENS